MIDLSQLQTGALAVQQDTHGVVGVVTPPHAHSCGSVEAQMPDDGDRRLSFQVTPARPPPSMPLSGHAPKGSRTTSVDEHAQEVMSVTARPVMDRHD